MKKFLTVILAGLTLGTPAVFAKGNLPIAGCGLGYVLFGKDNPNDKGLQIIAATTNACSGNQTFGITSGTLGCTESGAVAKNARAEVFADVNMRQLTHDIALGKGETLDTFSKIIGVKDASRDSFFKLVKSSFSSLFPAANTTSVEFLSRLDQVLSAHPELIS